MMYSHFHCPNCEDDFHIKYVFELDCSDVDYCPSCGHKGRIEKTGVDGFDGPLVSKGDVVES